MTSVVLHGQSLKMVKPRGAAQGDFLRFFLPSFLPDNHSLTSGSLFPKSFIFDSFSCLQQVQLLVHRSETFPTPLPACCDGAHGCDGRVVSLASAVFLPRVCSVSVLAYPLAMSWALIICTKYEINSEKYEI